MKKAIILAAALALSGCATNAEKMRADGPAVVSHTDKAPRAVMECFAAKGSHYAISERRGGYLIQFTAALPFQVFYEVYPEGEGSVVNTYRAANKAAPFDCL